MDYLTTAELAQILEDRADGLQDSDKEFSTQLRMCAHLLRLYAALECVYRERLGGDISEIADQVNRLFKKDHSG